MKMKCFAKEASVLLIIAVLLPSVVAMAANTEYKTATSTVMVATSGQTWYVPDDFPTIQGAIDNNSVKDGDTIMVRAGTYYENVVIDKSINLFGEDKNTTIINGLNAQWHKNEYTVFISSDGVVISGFSIVNYKAYNYYGINCSSDYNTIVGNYFTGDFYANAINLYCSDDNTIIDNYIHGEIYDGLIKLRSSSDNTIAGNTIINEFYGSNWGDMNCILLESSNSNTITDNLIESGYCGIYLKSCNSNTITSNTITDNGGTNEWGIYLESCNSNIITKNTITDSGVGTVFGIDLESSNSNTITDNLIEDAGYSLYLMKSSSNIITGNTIIGNYYINDKGIFLSFSNDNIIGGKDQQLKNIIKDNEVGIKIRFCEYYRSDLLENNTFEGNVIDIWGAKFGCSQSLPQSNPASQPSTGQQSAPSTTTSSSTSTTTTTIVTSTTTTSKSTSSQPTSR